MARFLLDSDAVIDWSGDVSASVALIRELLRRSEELCTCDIVVAEVHAGLRANQDRQARDLLDSCEFLVTSSVIARKAGEWRRDFSLRGIALATTDVLIAATALFHDATIVTGNVRDYPMDGVRLLPLPRSRRS